MVAWLNQMVYAEIWKWMLATGGLLALYRWWIKAHYLRGDRWKWWW
jgi:hypothetical protein